MIEMGIAEVQTKFTKLLSTPVTIVDKKSHIKRAVILPYNVYEKLAKLEQKERVFQEDKELESFVGLLKDKKLLDSDDERYKAIVK